jgi:hypothetical protein
LFILLSAGSVCEFFTVSAGNIVTSGWCFKTVFLRRRRSRRKKANWYLQAKQEEDQL